MPEEHEIRIKQMDFKIKEINRIKLLFAFRQKIKVKKVLLAVKYLICKNPKIETALQNNY